MVRLLEHLESHPEFSLGLLTGNAQIAAEAKLVHFGIDHYFRFGGFGDHDQDRNHVAQRAVQAARQQLGKDFDTERVWVIGDTVNDIRCSRAIGAQVLAVETGGVQRQELQSAAPNALFRDLSDVDQFLATVSPGMG